MKHVDEFGFPDLTAEQIETLCSTAENAARRYVLSKVAPKLVENLNISVEAEGTKPVNVTVEVELTFSPKIKEINAEKLAKEAVEEAHRAVENYLRKLACPS
ncbi:MAG: DUF3194 domain-containing protein [Candidatus Bathyarchaeota archaeon]|nr:DUF3194 domain-containing protein [Candidatus Bathyarchaeota archaeon]